MSTAEVILPKSIVDVTERLRNAEQDLEAARQEAVRAIRVQYARGTPARQLSNKYGGPFSYLTTLRHVNEGLAEMSPDEQKHLADTQPSLFG